MASNIFRSKIAVNKVIIRLIIGSRTIADLFTLLLFHYKEYFLIENQQSATDHRYGPCLYVDSKADDALIKVTGCNETDVRQRWTYTQKGQIMVLAGLSISRGLREF